ncbi:MAG: RibD family protein [Alphaproteobacteria bacterium]|nr:RibD family protein [Alphaproteobacteria bacterium]
MPEPADLCASVRAAPTDRPFVIAQIGQSLDGRIATSTGESQWINQSLALDHVHRLRATVDAVVVGVGTVVADDPLLNVRRVTGRNPARVVIDPNGRCPITARCFNDDGARRIIVRSPTARSAVPEGVEVIIMASDGRTIPPGDIVAAIYACGIATMLIEGGAKTVSQFVDAAALDRLHVLVSPIILGCGKTGLELLTIANLSHALRPATRVHALTDGDVLFDCDMRAQRDAAKP